MKRLKPRPKLIALVGGSGAGKSWLSLQLGRALRRPVTRLSLDDFYRDQSHLAPQLRERINFDHPRALDWRLAEAALRELRAGRPAQVPRYSFARHARGRTFKVLTPKAVILVDGLWLLWKPRVRRLFHFRVFVGCPERLRLERRLARDLAGRGRGRHSVRRQFQKTVAPMHKRFVEPQARWADMVLRQPLGRKEVAALVAVIKKDAGLAPAPNSAP